MIDAGVLHRLFDQATAALHFGGAEARIFLLDDCREARVKIEGGLGHETSC
jgi:hypothetical protein